MTRLFGTDGVRGRAFEPPLDEDTVRRLGGALGRWLGSGERRVLIAGDTRASTTTLAEWIAESLQASGATVVWGGTLPTPAVSQLQRTDGFDAGVVISASHNPAHDNGIKVLGPGGEKLDEAVEAELEALAVGQPDAGGAPLPTERGEYAERYLNLLRAAMMPGRPLDGMRVIVDAANGAASGLAEPLFDSIGADVTVIDDSPDGANINAGCGATVPSHVASEVRRLGADAGLALDGDADRAILVDETGEVVDGDDILLTWARDLKRRDRLPTSKVVGTVMANFGLERALAAQGIDLLRSAVGDRYVWLMMKSASAVLGGEPSGHIICAHHAVTGDGLLTGAALLEIAARTGRPLSQLSGLERSPQVLYNVRVRRKPPLAELPELQGWLQSATNSLGTSGRVLLRYSGTEPLARIMIEGDDEHRITALADDGRRLVRRLIGSPETE